MARPSVPKFGNWESEDNVPYTVYFDKARKNKGGKMINPNDPQENPDMFPDMVSSAPNPARAHPPRHRAQQEEPIGLGAKKPANRDHVIREDSELKFSGSPARSYNGGRGSGRPSRPSTGSENSFERSPLHPQHQARLTGRGNGSPSWEGKKLYESSHGTPGRSRMKPKTRDETPERDVAIPRFGDWDVNNPQSADNYTYIFDKNSKAATLADTNASPSHISNQKQHADDDAKFSQRCCFLWSKK